MTVSDTFATSPVNDLTSPGIRSSGVLEVSQSGNTPQLIYTVFDGLQWTSSRGLARFARQLRRHLQAMEWKEAPVSHPRWRSSVGRILIAELVEPFRALHTSSDVSFFPHNVLPAWLPRSKSLRVLVLHDVLFLDSENGKSAGNRYRRAKLAHSLRNADLILTVSEASRSVIQQLLERDVEVLVVPNCLADQFGGLELSTTLPANNVPVLLHFGGHAPSKNTRVLIDAVAQLVRSGTEVRLELAAMAGQEALVESWRVTAGLPQHALRVLPLLSDAELIEAYRRADVHVMPSTGEGFGIPVIEAARSGTLNVLTPLDVFREIMGDSAVYAAGFDASCVSAALLAGLSADRSAMVVQGYARTEQYMFESVHRFYAEPAMRRITQLVEHRQRSVEQ